MSTPSLQTCIEAAQRYKLFKKGWNSYKANPPNEVSHNNFVKFIKQSYKEDVIPSFIGPSAMGGIGIIFGSPEREVNIEFYNDGTAHSLFCKESTEDIETFPVPTSLAGYNDILEKIKVFLGEVT